MAKKIEHILVPTDGSDLAIKAAAFAGNLARALDARITIAIVHSDDAIQPLAWGAGGFPASATNASMAVDEIRARLEHNAEHKELADTVAALGKLSQPPELVQLWGHAAEQVCLHAEATGIDLIVMGSHGRSGFKRVLLGSVSNAVANHAHCPVMIVR